VALLLNMSERAVRNAEKRAIRELQHNPVLRRAWLAYLAGELDEDRLVLTSEEIGALFGLARTSDERRFVMKIV
jgi:hypothetical protein